MDPVGVPAPRLDDVCEQSGVSEGGCAHDGPEPRLTHGFGWDTVGGLHESHGPQQGYDPDRDLEEAHGRMFGGRGPTPQIDLAEVAGRLFGGPSAWSR